MTSWELDRIRQAEVDAAFSRVSAYLGDYHPAIAAHTADLAHPGSPWSLAWADWDGRHALLVCRSVGANDDWSDWTDAEPVALLATLSHLPELLARIARAVADLVRMADRSGETIGQVDAALVIAKGEG